METKSDREGHSAAQSPTPDGDNWHATFELLKKRQYEKVAELLHEIQITVERSGNLTMANLLASARQVCLACNWYRLEEESHLRDYNESVTRSLRREHELALKLHAILNQIREQNEQQFESLQIDRNENQSTTLRQRLKKIAQWVSHSLAVDKKLNTEQLDAVPASVPGATEMYSETSNLTTEAPSLVVYFLGSFRVYNNEHLIQSWPGNKSKTLFKYLIIHRGQMVHQDILMDLFWPNSEVENARRNLYQAIYLLRQALQSNFPDVNYVLSAQTKYGINPDLDVWVDSEAFERHYKSGKSLARRGFEREAIKEYEAAENLYDGEFLDEDIYEEWTLTIREHLKHSYLEILASLSQHFYTLEQFSTNISYCRKILREDSCREDIHRRLMMTYSRLGQRNLALRQYHQCVEAMQQELEAKTSPETNELYQKIINNHFHFSP